jgi:hypothetical protein
MVKKAELFPHQTFPIRLEYKRDDEKVLCWFQYLEYAEKQIKRAQLKMNQYKLTYRDGEPPRIKSQSHLKSVRQSQKSVAREEPKVRGQRTQSNQSSVKGKSNRTNSSQTGRQTQSNSKRKRTTG